MGGFDRRPAVRAAERGRGVLPVLRADGVCAGPGLAGPDAVDPAVGTDCRGRHRQGPGHAEAWSGQQLSRYSDSLYETVRQGIDARRATLTTLAKAGQALWFSGED